MVSTPGRVPSFITDEDLGHPKDGVRDLGPRSQQHLPGDDSTKQARHVAFRLHGDPQTVEHPRAGCGSAPYGSLRISASRRLR